MKKLLLSLSFVVLSAGALLAQLPPMLPGNPSQAPIDGGLSVLALAGGAYAYKKLRDARK